MNELGGRRSESGRRLKSHSFGSFPDSHRHHLQLPSVKTQLVVFLGHLGCQHFNATQTRT